MLEKQEVYIKLSDRIAWESCSLVEELLKEYPDLDILFEEGRFFISAIENNSTDIVDVLLKYFNNNQLSHYEFTSQKYIFYKKQLKDILDEAVTDVRLSDEMKEILSSYFNLHSDNGNTEQDSLFAPSIPSEFSPTQKYKEGISAISETDATTGNDHVLWDKYVQGNHKYHEKQYTEEYKAFCVQKMNILASENNNVAAIIRDVQKHLSNINATIPSESALRNWYIKPSDSHVSNLCYLSEENLKKLSKNEITKEEYISYFLETTGLVLASELLKEGKLDDAKQILQSVVTISAEEEQLNIESDRLPHEELLNLGYALFSLKKYKAAISSFDLIPDYYQDSLSAYIFKYLSHISLSTRNYEEALGSLKKAIMLVSFHKISDDHGILSTALQHLNNVLPSTDKHKIYFDKNVDREIIEYAINFKLVQSLLYTTIHQHYGDKSADHMQESVEKLTAFYCDNPSKIEEGVGQLSSIMQDKSQTITKILNDFLEKLSLDSNQHFSHSFSTPETNYTDAVSAHTHEQRSGSGDSSEVETLGATTQLHNDDIDIVY